MTRTLNVSLLLTIAALLTAAHPANHATDTNQLRSSAIAMTADGKRVVTVNPDSNSISVFNIDTRAVAERPTGNNPQTVSISGNRAFVANRDDDTISVVSLDDGTTLTIPACREPFAAIAHRDRLFVSCFGESSVAVLDMASWKRLAAIDVEIDPRGLAVSPDGSEIYLTHFTSGRLSVIDVDTLRVERVVPTNLDSNISQSVYVDPTTNLAYLAQTRSNVSNAALTFDSTVFPLVSVIDLATYTHVEAERIAIDFADRPTGIPIDAVRHGDRLFVVHSASNDLSIIDLTTKRAVGHLRVGASPRGLVLSPDGNRLYVNNTLDGTITVVDTTLLLEVEVIPVTNIPLAPRLLNGKRLFNSSADFRMAAAQWVACSSCHFDGGTDRRTWLFRDGPRNTPTLFGMAGTGPFHWSGDLDEAEDVESTIRLIQVGMGLAPGPLNCEPACNQGPPNHGRSNDLDDLAAYTESLRLRPRVRAMTAQAERGREIFFSAAAGCATCHTPPLFTDRQRHDVGTASSEREKKGSLIDTPSLLSLQDTAPYFHDGSAATLLDVVKKEPARSHGQTSHLSAAQLDDLVAYLKAIGNAPPRRRSVR